MSYSVWARESKRSVWAPEIRCRELQCVCVCERQRTSPRSVCFRSSIHCKCSSSLLAENSSDVGSSQTLSKHGLFFLAPLGHEHLPREWLIPFSSIPLRRCATAVERRCSSRGSLRSEMAAAVGRALPPCFRDLGDSESRSRLPARIAAPNMHESREEQTLASCGGDGGETGVSSSHGLQASISIAVPADGDPRSKCMYSMSALLARRTGDAAANSMKILSMMISSNKYLQALSATD